jgi:hypothetical protein
MLEIARKLCMGITGSQCAPPSVSHWSLAQPSNASISVDLVDVGTAGVGSAIPVNVKVYAGAFETLLMRNGAGAMCAALKGRGGGAGVSAGLSMPFVGAKVVGKMPEGFKKEVVKRIGNTAQGEFTKWISSKAWGGISGGTKLITGPDCPGELSLADFARSFATVIAVAGNFGPNGVSAGLVIFSKLRPVLQMADMLYARSFGLMAGVGLATSIDLEASGQVFRVDLA